MHFPDDARVNPRACSAPSASPPSVPGPSSRAGPTYAECSPRQGAFAESSWTTARLGAGHVVFAAGTGRRWSGTPRAKHVVPPRGQMVELEGGAPCPRRGVRPALLSVSTRRRPRARGLDGRVRRLSTRGHGPRRADLLAAAIGWLPTLTRRARRHLVELPALHARRAAVHRPTRTSGSPRHRPPPQRHPARPHHRRARRAGHRRRALDLDISPFSAARLSASAAP